MLAAAIGLLTVVTGVVSSAAVTLGSAGYIQQFIDLPKGPIVVIVTVLLGAVAAWGIRELVVLASLFTLIEVGGGDRHRRRHSRRPSHCRDDNPVAAAGRRSLVRHRIGSGSRSSPLSASRIWPMSWRRRRSRTATFPAPWC